MKSMVSGGAMCRMSHQRSLLAMHICQGFAAEERALQHLSTHHCLGVGFPCQMLVPGRIRITAAAENASCPRLQHSSTHCCISPYVCQKPSLIACWAPLIACGGTQALFSRHTTHDDWCSCVQS